MDKIKVMINGIPGKMACLVAEKVLIDDRFELILFSFTGPEITASKIVIDSRKIALILPNQREKDNCYDSKKEGALISVDYTFPSAVNDNAKFYCDNDLPFVMGTTGGNKEFVNEIVASSIISAVVAPNMAKQIVGFQAMMEWAAENFPNLFDGFSLRIRESHQKGKLDTSGTAKAMVEYFNKLGIQFLKDEIVMVRDPEIQKTRLGVPEEFLNGHGWHTYTLVSPDKTVRLEFTHNVSGRDIYAMGTLDAIAFLDKKVKEGIRGRVFSMIDVLKGN